MAYRILPRALRSGSLRAWQGLIFVAALCLLVLGAWAFVVHGEARRQAEREAGRAAAVVAQSVAREHERLLDAARQLLLALSQRPEVVTVNPAACSLLLSGVLGAVPGYLDLVAARPGGEVFCSARGAARLPATASAADVRRTAESGAPSLGRYAIDRERARPAVALSTAAVDDAGAVRAVVVGVLDLGQLERAALESPLPPGAAMLLVDGHGVVLSHHLEPQRWTGEILDEPLRRLLAEQGAGLVPATWLDGVPSLLLFEPLAREAGRLADVTVVIALPRRSVFHDADRLFGLELAGLGLLALGGLVCGALVTDRLVARPVQGLLRVIRSLDAGDVRARMRQSDERRHVTGRLARSVNSLGRRLEAHQKVTRHLEDELRQERAARGPRTPPLPAEPPAPVAAEASPAAAPRPRPPRAAERAPVETAAPPAPLASAPAVAPPDLLETYGDVSSEEYWHLREAPFENAPNPRFLWLSPLHSDALVRLTYALRQRRGCAMLTGEPGCGKTLLTRAVVERLEASRYEIALVTNPHGGRTDLLRQVLYELGIDTGDTARTELEHTLHDLIVGTARRGRETLVIVDDAQNADDPAWFEELSSLLNIQTNERTLVTILLSGTPELTAAVRRVQHLDRRVSIRCALDPLTEEQTAQYVRYRLGVAGGDAWLFGRGAVMLIHAASRGVPRAINDLCDGALLLARLHGHHTIDEHVVRRVLTSGPTEPAPRP
ncbi:MAG TPA: AAA family ATPase [Methylomirabilota bacterium]|nr:AAA family ATPase [Methylomirabilota bacterium]